MGGRTETFCKISFSSSAPSKYEQEINKFISFQNAAFYKRNKEKRSKTQMTEKFAEEAKKNKIKY